MEFDFSNAYDGKRMSNVSRASVQANGRLRFPPEAACQMGLSLEKALLICPMGEKNLAVTVVEKDDPNGFVVRKTGPYFYVPFFAMMSEYGIDCAKVRVAYDIIRLQENHNGNPVFGFFRTEC